ncbi:TPA: hypothetical protein EYN98_20930 [Candidatus Poribacteria bacterium]|nr:hypothetical protein [Candidatus Poribacteria bacterium]HIB99923.1 hypothetical protein [Candidatus Poribacteria bacterium]HIO75994.1 hypothetical protein [Gammaproteobacteria bacterium]
MGKGIKFDLMFRMGIIGNIPRRIDSQDFVTQHPEYRQVLRDGTVIEKASYAFPVVQQLMLDLIREATTLIDADGINLCFTRGPHFLSYEQPILDAFTAQYGGDACEVDPKDVRLLEVRASFMTDFMHKVRRVLDEVGAKKGKRLELSIWAWPHGEFILADGGYMHRLGPEIRAKWLSVADEAGVESFAYWDGDFAQINPELWAWLRRIGHREERSNWDHEAHKVRSVHIHTIDGIDVLQGKEQAVYSGG